MTEIDALIEDLGLIPLSSQEAQDLIRVQLSRNVHDVEFSDISFSPVFENLCELMYKRNRKYSRFVPCTFDLQLKLPL